MGIGGGGGGGFVFTLTSDSLAIGPPFCITIAGFIRFLGGLGGGRGFSIVLGTGCVYWGATATDSTPMPSILISFSSTAPTYPRPKSSAEISMVPVGLGVSLTSVSTTPP